MTTPEKPGEPEPILPEGMTANDIRELSEKDQTEFAKAAGMTIGAYKRFIEKRARAERVKSTIASIQKNQKSDATENIYDKQAKDAVIQGIRVIVEKLTIRPVTEAHERRVYDEAYRLLERAGRTTHPDQKELIKEQAHKMFTEVVTARAVGNLIRLLREGHTFSDAKRKVADELEIAARRQNMRELEDAYHEVAGKVRFDFLHQERRDNLDQIVRHYEAGSLTDGEEDFLKRITQCAKAAYFKGTLTKETLERFGLVEYRATLQPVVQSYAKHGPHKKTSDNVAGPTEVFGSVQSRDMNMGYNRKGKRRPQRDPSGGSGEKF